MADPDKYTPSFDFSDFEENNPREPKPGDRLDIEFANIADTTGETIDALADIRRSDGALNNGIVTLDSLDDAVRAVLGESDALDIVAENIADITTVAADLNGTNATGTVAASIASVNTVSFSIGNVNIVAADLAGDDNIGTVAADLNGTNATGTVAASIANVNAVGAIDADVAAVAGVSANVTTVAAIDDDVTTVAGIAAAVSTAAANAAAISAVAANETNIDAVAGNAANINAAVANEAAINAAPQAATDAADARDLAQKWANEAEDVIVESGEYSAYHWSKKAEQAAAGSSDNIANQSDVDGATVTDALNTLAAAGIPGQISAFAFNTAPDGWLKANGAVVSRTTYAALFAAIGTTFGAGDGSTTFNLPDLRGEFLRGWDDGRGVDSGRAFGSAQGDQNKSHSHTGTAASAGAHTHSASTNSTGSHTHTTQIRGDGNSNTQTSATPGYAATKLLASQTWSGYVNDQATRVQADGSHSHTVTVNSGGAHTHTLSINADGGTEARPRNVALLYCIKY